jgi:hypothetical protein
MSEAFDRAAGGEMATGTRDMPRDMEISGMSPVSPANLQT